MQIGSLLATSSPVATVPGNKSQSAVDPLSAIAPSKSDDTETELMKFLKMSPAEKMQYTWLHSHGLTKEDLAAMKPEERAAIQKQMMQELQEMAKQRAEKKNSGNGAVINVVV